MDFRERPELRSAPLITTTHPPSSKHSETTWSPLPFVVYLHCSKKIHGEQLLCHQVFAAESVFICQLCPQKRSFMFVHLFRWRSKVRWYIKNYIHVIESIRDVFSVFHFWQAALYSGNDVRHSFAHLVLPNAWSQNRFRLFAVTTVCFHQEETGKLLCVLEKY